MSDVRADRAGESDVAPAGPRAFQLFIYIYIYIYISNTPIYI